MRAVKPCGTYAAYRRHKAAGEQPCEDCIQAHRAYDRELYAKKPKVRKPSLRERLLSKAIINWETGCWEWSGSRGRDGYGTIGLPNRKTGATHRVAYELIEGPIPAGLDLDHLCRVRHCINPAHLEPVTRRENTLRGTAPAAAFAKRDRCSAGHIYTDASTLVSGRKRSCRICACNYAKRYRARLAASRQGGI